MRGAFVIHEKDGSETVIPNNVLVEGELSYLKMITRADVIDVAAGGNFYIGLMTSAMSNNSTLATISEPVGNGYARQAVTRDAVGWPSITQVNGVYRAQTKQVTFDASGGDYTVAINRMFICNVLSGTSGLLFGASGTFPTGAITLLDGESLTVSYNLWLA